jgi:hypothetical protein
MFTWLKQLLGMSEWEKSPAQSERDSYVDAIINAKQKRHFQNWVGKQDPFADPAIHARNMAQLIPQLKEAYGNLPLEDIIHLANRKVTPGPEAVREVISDIEAVTASRFYEDPDPMFGPVEIFRVPEGEKGGEPFESLSVKEKAQVLGDYTHWQQYEQNGIGFGKLDQIFVNVINGKPKSEWLEGTGLPQPVLREEPDLFGRPIEKCPALAPAADVLAGTMNQLEAFGDAFERVATTPEQMELVKGFKEFVHDLPRLLTIAARRDLPRSLSGNASPKHEETQEIRRGIKL